MKKYRIREGSIADKVLKADEFFSRHETLGAIVNAVVFNSIIFVAIITTYVI